MRPLDRITIQGFKSIRNLPELTLGRLNILIGANGSGKSNFISFFKMLECMSRGGLQNFVRINGNASTFCHNGPEKQSAIKSELIFGTNAYRFILVPSLSEELLIIEEASLSQKRGWRAYTEARPEARLANWGGEGGYSGVSGARNVCGHIHDAINSWRVYHFHDTSNTAPLRRPGLIGGDKRLLQDGSNLAPFLLYLEQQHRSTYKRIIQTIQLIAPFFITFSLEPEVSGPDGSEICRLRWVQKGSERLMQPWQFSDGTIRFIALIVALMQPTPPSTILIDEPELGLHPRALSTFRGLIHEASNRMQVIVTTQSPSLLRSMSPEDIITIGREHGASTFNRLNRNELHDWLEEYTLEDLWNMNVIHAGPDYE